MSGSIDEVSLFSRALSPAQIAAEMNRKLGFWVFYSTNAGGRGTWSPRRRRAPGPISPPTAWTGSAGPLTVSVADLSLVQSTNPLTCAGVAPCGATNQVKFVVADRRATCCRRALRHPDRLDAR